MDTPYRNLVEVPQRGYHYFRHYFLPRQSNNQRPLALRPNALKMYSIALILIKVSVTGLLYAAYPNEGQFAELTVGKVFSMTNEARQANGVGTLRLNPKLTAAAQAKARDLLTGQYFAHTSPQGKQFWEWIQDVGYSYSTAGENLAMDFTTAESAQNALMASPTHRANILKSAYKEIGLAVVQGEFQGRSTTILVEEYGAPLKNAVVEVAAPKPQQVVKPATKVAGTETTALTYDAHVDAIGTATATTGETILVPVTITNTGTATWSSTGDHFAAINTADPAGRVSAFGGNDWLQPYRPVRLEHDVAPATSITISMPLHAPQQAGSYTETFGVVLENLTWVTGGTFTVPLTVTATATPVVAATPQEPTVHDPFATPTPLSVAATTHVNDWMGTLVQWSSRFLWLFLVLLTGLLGIAIVAKAHLQHQHMVADVVVVLGLATFLAVTQFHFLQHLSTVLLG